MAALVSEGPEEYSRLQRKYETQSNIFYGQSNSTKAFLSQNSIINTGRVQWRKSYPMIYSFNDVCSSEP